MRIVGYGRGSANRMSVATVVLGTSAAPVASGYGNAYGLNYGAN